MKIYKRLQEIFSLSQEIQKIVEERFFSVSAEDDVELPYIVSSAMEKPITKDGLMETQLHIRCYGQSYDQVRAIADQIQKLLEKESGFVFRGMGDGREREKFEIIITYKVN